MSNILRVTEIDVKDIDKQESITRSKTGSEQWIKHNLMLKISSKLHTDENNDMNATKENKAMSLSYHQLLFNPDYIVLCAECGLMMA